MNNQESNMAAPPAPGGPYGPQALQRVRRALAEAQQMLDAIEGHLGLEAMSGKDDGEKVRTLSVKLREAEEDRKQLVTRLEELEMQVGRLMNLYVATYQLHASLDPIEVQRSLSEIATNLLGVSSFALLLHDDETGKCRIVVPEDVPRVPHPFNRAEYCGGDPMIDVTLADGVPMFGGAKGSAVLATVPLNVEGLILGALVVLELLPHKSKLDEYDRELLELIGAHAASAMVAAETYSSTAMRLESLAPPL